MRKAAMRRRESICNKGAGSGRGSVGRRREVEVFSIPPKLSSIELRIIFS